MYKKVINYSIIGKGTGTGQRIAADENQIRLIYRSSRLKLLLIFKGGNSMLRKSFSKTIFAAFLIFVLSTTALALSPQDSLSARPANSQYIVLGVNDLNGFLKEAFSSANIELLEEILDEDQAQILGLITSFTAQIPANTVTIAAGMTADMQPFVQAAILMPESVRTKLNNVANGTASPADMITLLLGDAAMMFAEAFKPELQKGASGPYYSFDGQVVFAAKEDLLLIATSPEELEASLAALEKKDNRLAFNRRFDSPNYLLGHFDYPKLAQMLELMGENPLGDPESLSKLYKAPLEIEFALSANTENYLFSFAVNALEALTNAERFKDRKPEKGAGLFMRGGGKLLFAVASHISFNLEDMKAFPEAMIMWEQLAEGLKAFDIPESDLEALLDGSISIALGNEATFMGMKVPGGHISITGRDGAAGRIFGKLMENPLVSESIPLVSLDIEGWDTLYTVNQEMMPMPILFGVDKETLFLGFINSDALDKKPDVSPEVAKMLDNQLFGAGVIDVNAIWNLLREEIANPNSMLSMAPGVAEMKELIDEILGADVSVPLIKMWSPEMETVFMEISVVDVPAEKRLLPRLIEELSDMFE